MIKKFQNNEPYFSYCVNKIKLNSDNLLSFTLPFSKYMNRRPKRTRVEQHRYEYKYLQFGTYKNVNTCKMKQEKLYVY